MPSVSVDGLLLCCAAACVGVSEGLTFSSKRNEQRWSSMRRLWKRDNWSKNPSSSRSSIMPLVFCNIANSLAIAHYHEACLFTVGCLATKQHAKHNSGMNLLSCIFCHNETEVASQTCSLTQSQHTDTGPTSS